ncbi:unnamed protein product [Symbiodinium sp. CCMP2592]|nr:unnamed protein product [Symbiodinium sp. CCMP2592]
MKKEPGHSTDDAAVLELQNERKLLLQKQDELNRKIALLAERLPGTASTSGAPTSGAPVTRCSIPEPHKDTEEDQSSDDAGDNDEGEGDDGDWGLGSVLCPKTGKVTKWHMDVLTADAVKQRLRRMCKRRKSGKVPGGEEAFESYKDVGNRKQLAKLLVDAKFNEEKEKSLTVDAGWYTEQEMKEKLQYDSCLG